MYLCYLNRGLPATFSDQSAVLSAEPLRGIRQSNLQLWLTGDSLMLCNGRSSRKGTGPLNPQVLSPFLRTFSGSYPRTNSQSGRACMARRIINRKEKRAEFDAYERTGKEDEDQ